MFARMLVVIAVLPLMIFSQVITANAKPGGTASFRWHVSTFLAGVPLSKPHIFPSFILTTALMNQSNAMNVNTGKMSVHIIGNRIEPFGIMMQVPMDNAHIHLAIHLDGIATDSQYDATLSTKGYYVIFPKIDFRYDVLPRVAQPTPANAKFALYVNGKYVGEKDKTVIVHSVNDCPFAVQNTNGQIIDLKWMFAAYVNENQPLIDNILRDALNTEQINSFEGYQTNPQGVVNQVFAIWDALQRRHLTYSNITQPSIYSNQAYSQHVRFFDQAVNNSEANCVDGTVMFASILMKIGIDPFLVLIPHHMFLGFYLDATHRQKAILETTAIGNTDLSDHIFINTVSMKAFNYALRVGTQEFNTEFLPNFTTANLPNYELIDIKQARQRGVMPISH